jgi:hypothetical protein
MENEQKEKANLINLYEIIDGSSSTTATSSSLRASFGHAKR